MKFFCDDRGQTLILAALCLPCLLAFVGLATDVGVLLNTRRQMQAAADAAAIAGAQVLNYSTTTTDANSSTNVITIAADAASAANGFPITQTGVTVTIEDPPQWPSSNYYSQSGYVEATVSQPVSTIFMKIFGFPTVTVAARAVASNGGPANGCVYTLGATGNDMHIQGSAAINASACGLVVDSSSSNAMTQTGNGPNLYAHFSSIGVVGNPGTLSAYSPTPIAEIAPASDPLSYIPQYSCNGSSCGCNPSSGTSCTGYPYSSAVTCKAASGSTLSPGCYNGLSGNYTLSTGTYIINGDISGGITGTGVTLILTSGSIVPKGNTTMTLSAPSAANDPSHTNPFDGILIDQVLADTTGTDMKGTPTFNAQGIIYMPGAEFEMEGNSSGTIYADFVVNSLDLQGDDTIYDYQALTGVVSPIHSISLVE
jgi:hypothetical protein